MTNRTNGNSGSPSKLLANGPSMADITAKFRNARLRVGGAPAQSESLPDAFTNRVKSFKQDMAMSRLQEIETKQIEADVEAQTGIAEVAKLEAEVKSLELQQRLKELRESTTGVNSPQNAMMMMMFEQLMNQRNQQREESPFEAAMVHIMQELADIRKESMSPKSEKPPMEKISDDLQMLISLKALMAEMSPAPAPRASDAQHDLETTIAMKRMELDHEHKLMEIELTKDRYRAELSLREKEVAAEERKASGFAQGLGSLAEAIKPVAAELMQQFNNKPNAPAPAPIYSPPAMANGIPAPVANPNSGFIAPMPLEPMQCNECGTSIAYPTDHSITEVHCPNPDCNEGYSIDWNAS